MKHNRPFLNSVLINSKDNLNVNGTSSKIHNTIIKKFIKEDLKVKRKKV